jgi:hypothetical protein
MTTITFEDTLKRRDTLLHKKAVLAEMVGFLGQFIDTDATPAKTGITTEGSGMVVPQEVVEEIKNQLEQNIEKMDAELAELNKMKVEDHEPEQNKGQPKGKGKGQKRPATKGRRRTPKARPDAGQSNSGAAD